MKKIDKINLISDIGRELQARMTFSEIDNYLSLFGISTDHEPSSNSKWVYVKEILPKVETEKILSIAKELGIDSPVADKYYDSATEEPSFWKPGYFKLFVSHISEYRSKLIILKRYLEKYGISAFIAHNDIEPTAEWEIEIEKGLRTMDALCAVLMPGFQESNWTDQEVGVAIGRKMLIIPVTKGLTPYGFVGKYQAFSANGKSVKEVAEGVFEIIINHSKTRRLMINTLVDLFLLSNTPSDALERIKLLEAVDNIPVERIRTLYERALDNENLNDYVVLNKMNKLFIDYGFEKLTQEHFDNKSGFLEDDLLPF